MSVHDFGIKYGGKGYVFEISVHMSRDPKVVAIELQKQLRGAKKAMCSVAATKLGVDVSKALFSAASKMEAEQRGISDKGFRPRPGTTGYMFMAHVNTDEDWKAIVGRLVPAVRGPDSDPYVVQVSELEPKEVEEFFGGLARVAATGAGTEYEIK